VVRVLPGPVKAGGITAGKPGQSRAEREGECERQYQQAAHDFVNRSN